MTFSEEDFSAIVHALPTPIIELARSVVGMVSRVRPDLYPEVKRGWKSVNFRHGKAGFVCAVFPYVDRVALVFERGRLLSNDAGLLTGAGSQVRFIPFRPGDDLPEDEIAILLAEAIALRG
jgi:hypothetical protein